MSIVYTTGNLLDAPVDALVNTVNTVGVMGKGIALMFKERFPSNNHAYVTACKAQQVRTGQMFVTETGNLLSNPRWIINFPTKEHWRSPSQMAWIEQGLVDLRRVIGELGIKSIAIPPLGAGNGGLPWEQVRNHIENALSDLEGVQIHVYEPSPVYQNTRKSSGKDELTPARALVVEMIRRYLVLGMECSLLEVQKLAWFLKREINLQGLSDPLRLQFNAHRYGPYAPTLTQLLNHLDGSYLRSDVRIPDCHPLDVIWVNLERAEQVQHYLHTDAQAYLEALEGAADLVDGFESPFGMELLATVDWALLNMEADATPAGIKEKLNHWPAGSAWAERKLRIFDDHSLQLALDKLTSRPELYPHLC